MTVKSKKYAGTSRLKPDVIFRLTDTPIRIIRLPSQNSTSVQHSHGFHELVVILDGRGIHNVGEEEYKIETGDVFVILGDTTHGYTETDNLSLINILFDPGKLRIPRVDLGNLPGYHALFTIEPRIRHRRKFQNRLRLPTEKLSHAVELIAKIEEELTAKKGGYRFMAMGYLMELIGFLSRCYTNLQAAPTRPIAHISRLLSFFNEHYSEPLSIGDLTAIVHMSQTSLMRNFKQITGRSPIDYLIRLRISRAESMLRHSDLSITDIALDVGFEDSNYFSRQFRKIRGISPRRFRTGKGADSNSNMAQYS